MQFRENVGEAASRVELFSKLDVLHQPQSPTNASANPEPIVLNIICVHEHHVVLGLGPSGPTAASTQLEEPLHTPPPPQDAAPDSFGKPRSHDLHWKTTIAQAGCDNLISHDYVLALGDDDFGHFDHPVLLVHQPCRHLARSYRISCI